MPIPEGFIIIVVITLIALPFTYIMFILNSISDFLIAKRIQKEIDKALVNVFQTYSDTLDYEQSLFELSLIMQKLTPKSSFLSKKYDTLLTLMECFVVNINCGKIEDKDIQILKNQVLRFVAIYKQKNPLEQISGSNYAVLKELLDNDDYNKQIELVNQLAIELKKKEDQISVLQSSNKKTTILTIIGVALTIVFGVVAIILAL